MNCYLSQVHIFQISMQSLRLQANMSTCSFRFVPNLISPMPNAHTDMRERIDLQPATESVSY